MGAAGAVALLLFMYGPVASAESGSIGIAPAFPQKGNDRTKGIFIHTLKGGESAEDGVQIYNYTKDERTVVLGSVDSIAAADGSFSCKQNSERQSGVGTWVSLETTKVNIPAESNKVVKFQIAVPKDTSPGEHDGCLTAQDTKNFASTSGSGVLLGFRNAIRMVVTVPGKIVKKLSFSRIDITRKSNGDYVVTPVAHNSGNVSLDVNARVQMVGLFGQKTPIQSSNFPVLPGATTGWGFTFARPFWGGLYKARTFFGYNANPADTLGQNIENQTKIRKETGYVYMLPAPQAAAVLLAVPLCVVFFIITLLRRRYRRRTLHKRMEQYTVQPGDTITGIAKVRGVKWRKLARLNGLKAPYLLEAGKTLFVPHQSEKKSRRRRKSSDEGTWVVEQPPLQNPTEERPQAPPAVKPAPVNNDWQTPAPVPPPAPPARFPEPSYAPAPPTTEEYEEPYDDVPDWREGATADELRKLGVLSGSSAVPKISHSWDMDTAPEPAKQPTRKKPAAAKKKPAKKSPPKRNAKSKKG